LTIRSILPARVPLASAVAVSPDGATLACGCTDGAVVLWELATGAVRRVLPSDRGRVDCLAFRPTKTLTVSHGTVLARWDLTDGRLIRTVQGPQAQGRLCFRPDSEVFASRCHRTHTFTLHDVLTGNVLCVVPAPFSNSGMCVAASHDGGRIAFHLGRDLVLRDMPTGAERCLALTCCAYDIAFSPDGTTLAVAGSDGSITLVDVGAWEVLRVLLGHCSRITCLTFWAGSAALASVADDGTVRLWDTAAGTCLAVLLACSQGWASVALDGRYKMGGHVDGAFWYAIGACRYEPGELDAYLPALRVPEDEPFFTLSSPMDSPTPQRYGQGRSAPQGQE
jgi:WD40 repeat protein